MTDSDTWEHPAATHRRTFALIKQVRTGDAQAQASLLADLDDPFVAGATLVSLCQIVNRVLDEFAPDPGAWLDGKMLELATAEGREPTI